MSMFDKEVKSTLKYQVLFSSGALMHMTFLVIFFFAEVYVLMFFNFISVGIYVAGAFASNREGIEKHVFGWIITLYSEITIHAILCTITLGSEVGFFMYSMMALTVVSYTLYLSCSRETFNRAIIIFAVITFISLIFSIAFSLCFDPLFLTIWGKELTESQTSLMLVVNILFCTLLIFFFTLLFVMEINTVLKKLGKTNERLNYIATHDALTGLFNRHSLRELFTELESSDEEYCVIMGDIDDFKKVNDTYGHDCGDIVLKSVAEIIAKNLGVRDVACRWGGEEFLMIMRGTRDECFARISLIKAQINALKIDHEGSRVRVSMTFGFADCGENGDPPTTAAEMDSLISMVDKRLYKGKTSGKNVIVVQN